MAPDRSLTDKSPRCIQPDIVQLPLEPVGQPGQALSLRGAGGVRFAGVGAATVISLQAVQLAAGLDALDARRSLPRLVQ